MRAALLALAFAVLLGGWLALAPAKVDAQGATVDGSGAYPGLWVAKYGDAAVCPAQGDREKLAGNYLKGVANAITLRLLIEAGGTNNCGPATVLTTTGYGNAPNHGNEWLLQLRTATGPSGGTLISGAHIGLPSGFSSARAVAGTTYNYRHSYSGGDGGWPLGASNSYGTPYTNAAITFTIPATHTGPVFLRAAARLLDSNQDFVWEDFSFKFNEAKVGVHPLVLPLDSSGEPATTDASAGRLRPTGGTLQRARLLLRAAAHGGAYAAADANAARSAFSSATLKITSDAAGATAINGATITQSDGTSAISACTENTAGHTCTVTSANWPQSTGGTPLTEPLNVHFQVPASHTGNAYLVLTAARTNYGSRNFALQYATSQVSIYPLAAPQNDSGTITTGNLVTSSRTWAVVGGAQRAAIFLRSAAHGDEYDSTDTNVARSAFTEAQIEIAADPGGARPIAGAKIGNSSALTSAITACTETTVGNTCTITSASYPQGSGMSPVTSQLDIYFSVPDRHEGDAYVVVRAFGAGAAPRTFALKYDPAARTAAHPLPVPVSGGSPVDWDVALAQRDFAASAGRQQVRLFLRDAAATRYVAGGTNAARSDFYSATIKVTSDEAGTTALSGALISDSAGAVLSACQESTAGHTCEIRSTNFPESGSPAKTTHQDIWFSVPSGHTAPVYLTVTTAQSARRNSYFELKYDPPSASQGTFALVNGSTAACPRAEGHVLLDAGAYARGGSTSVTINPRRVSYGAGDACTTTTALDNLDLYVPAVFQGNWRISVNHAPGDGTPIAGAAISLPAGFAGARSGGRNPRSNLLDGNWPERSGTSVADLLNDAAISFTVPSGHSGPVYLYLQADAVDSGNSNGGTARATFKFLPALNAHPLAAPQTSSGTITETGDLTANTRRYAVNDATQRAAIFLRDADHGDEYDSTDANAARSEFDAVTIKITEDAAGATAISGAEISSDSAGNTAIGACDESAVGHTCTIPAASWPQNSATPPRTRKLDIHFSVPEAHPGPAYVVVTIAKAGSPSRRFALKYEHPYVPVWPLAAPQDAGGTVSTSELAMTSRDWAAGGASQRARVFFRDRPRTAYDASHQSPVTTAFAALTIKVTSDSAGANVISGAKISSDSAGNTVIGACDESSVGHTCTVQTANFPSASGRTTNLDLHFSVPNSHNGDVFLVLTATKSPDLPRVFALKYDDRRVGVFPLAAPQNAGGTITTGTLASQTRLRAASGTQRAAVFLRSANPDDEYDSSDVNAVRGDFGSATIVISSDAAGTTAISGAVISQSDGTSAIAACTEATAGNTCTIPSASFPQDSGTPARTQQVDIYFAIPAAYIGDAYVTVRAAMSSRTSRIHALKYEDPAVAAAPLAVPAESTGALAAAREGQDISAQTFRWAAGGGTTRAKVFLRAAAHGNTYRAADANAAEAGIDSVRIRLSSVATGASEAAGTTLIASAAVGGASICSEGTAGPTCTITAANWPDTSGTTDEVNLRFTVPATSDATVHLVVSAIKSGKTSRTFALELLPGSVPAHPLAAAVVGGSPESGDLAAIIRSFRSGGERQQVRVALRDAWHGNEWDASDANAQRSEFTSATIEVGTKHATTGVFSALSGAAIYNAATGSTALMPCTENTAGDTCTIQSASFPVDSGTPVRTEEVDLWFSVPAATAADVYLRVTAAGTGESRVFELKYEPYLRIWPLIVPDPAGTRESGNVKTGTRDWAAEGAANQAEVYLRGAEHSNAYDANHANVARSTFDSVELRLATAEDGTTSASGPVFTGSSGGGSVLSDCSENAQGAVCTITSANWPQGTGGTPLTLLKNVHFTVPDTHDAAVWLVARVKKANKADRVFSIRYDAPYTVYPIAVPASTADGTDLSAGSRNFLPAGNAQQLTVHLRDAWHGDAYDASDSNAATSDLFNAVISIAANADGSGLITGAEISADSAGNTGLTGCGNPAVVGNTCTISAANWPASSGATTGLDLYFSVPNTAGGAAAYVVVIADPAASGKRNRAFALKYDPPLPVFPLAVPLGAADAHESGDLTARTENYASAGARQKARVYLRNAWHSNTYASTGQTNAPTSDFSSVTIRIADGSDGSTAVSGALITNASGAQLSQCAAAGATCLVNSWPASAGTSQPLDIWFAVPDGHRADVFLHVTVRDSDGDTQTFAIPYENPHIEAWPLIVPQLTSTTFETGTLSSNSRHWWPYAVISTTSSGDNSTGRHWLRLFLRDEERTSYGSAHANAAAAEFDATTLQITSDAAGQTLLSGAAFTTAAGRSRSCGNTCPDSTPAADATVYFKIPDSHTGPVYIRYGVTKSGKIGKTYTLKYDPPPTVAAHPILTAREADGSARAAAGEYSEGAADRVRLSIRDAAASATSAATSTFLAVTITAASDADGTALSGAVLSSDAAGSNAISACTENTAGNTCTITTANWPATGGNADDLDLYVTVPAAHTGALYVHVNIIAPAGIRNRAAALKYDPYLRIWPLVVPAPSGTRETGNVKTATRDWAAPGAANQAQIFLRNAAHSNTYSATGALVARSAFDRVILRLATAEDGTTSASGPVFTGSTGGTSVLSDCSETSQGPVCTITSANWPQGTGNPALTLLQDVYFTVPGEHGSVWLVATVQESGKADRVFSIRYDSPVVAYALVVPSGTADGANLAAGARNFVPGGVAQQATVYMRSAWHDDEYNAADANADASVLTSATITIAANADGTGPISGAEISANAAGTTALGSGCASVANSCTITSWPATGGLAFYFSVPNTVSTSAYVVVTGVAAANGKAVRATALEYAPPLPVFPLAVPRHPTTDAHESGTLTSRTENFAAQGARNKATIYLRDAWHSNAYAATGQDNAPASDFSSVTIRIATASDGSTAVSGAAIVNASGARLPQCAAAGPTCLVSNWPATGGTADPLDIWFTVPASRTADAYLHVTVRDSDGDAQTFAIPYQPPYVAAWPLIVPKPGGTYETGTLSTATRRWLPEQGLNLIGFFFRDQERTAFDGNHASPAAGVYDGHMHAITTDAAGNNRLSGAAFTDSAGNAFTCGNRCMASWLQGDLRFKIPDSHTGAVYIHLTATKPGKQSRSTSLKWDPPLTVSGHPGALPFDDDGTVGVPPAGEFSATGGTDRARISLRTAAGSSTGAATSAFQSVKLTLASDAAGTALTGAVLASNAAGTTALTGCSEGSTAGNTCTIPVASWPATGGAAGDLDLYFTVPLTHAAAVYLHIRVENAGERDRTFALKYEAPVGTRSNNAGLALDPRLSDGAAEQDDDGDGDRTDNEHYYGLAAERQRLAVRIYKSAATSGWDETVELATFASLHSTEALILSANYPTGPQTTTSLNASQIVFTKPDGTALGCSEASYTGGTCTLTRATLKTLMGITGAADARRSLQFEFAFAIKTAFTSSEDVTLNLQLKRHDNGLRSAAAVYKRGAAAASNAQPFARPIGIDGTAETGNVLMSEDAQAHRFRRYRPGGQDTPVQLLVYDSATAINTYSSSTNRVSYGTISEVKIEVKTRPTANNLASGVLIANAQVKVLKNDGTSACTEAAVGNVCTITSANFLAAGPPRAGSHYRALPLEFDFSVPTGHMMPNFGNANLVVTVVRTGSGTLAQRTQTFTLPFDGGTRAEPFAMVADATGNAPAADQQWAQAGARTRIWAHVYNAAKTAHEAVTGTNTAQYWEFDQASGATAVKIELLDGASGMAAPSGGLITAADSAAKFAPCTESEPSNVCTITLAALKSYDSEASPDDNDEVDPLKFAVSIPQGSTNSVRLKLTVNRSDSMTKVREFRIYAPWAYPLLAPVGADGRPRSGSLSATVWEYEPRGRPTPLALELYNARRQQYVPPTAALRPSFADFETVTIRVQDAAGDLISGAELTARNGTPLRGLCPVAASCEITRAEWQARQRGARTPGGLEFAASVPAEYSAAAVIRIELAHTGRTAPAAAQPVNEQMLGTGPVQRIALEDSSGTRTAVYELRMVSPAKRAFALPLIADAATGLRVCTLAESGSGAAALTACTAPSVQRGTPIGFAAALMRGLEAHPANPPTANGDELVQYNEITTLTITATSGEIIHQALCPRAAAEHPVHQPAAQTDASTCTISSAALQAFQGAAEANEPIRPLQLAYVPSAASGATGTVRLSYAIAGASPPEMIEQTLEFAHAAGPGKRTAGVYLDWSDPGSAYAAAAPAALFAIGRADSRATAAPAPRSALPGRVKSALFSELAADKAVELTISQGTLSYNGAACTASSAGCTLSLSRAQLLAGAGTATASDPIGNLRAEYALPLGVSGPTTISVRASFDGEADPAVGELAIAHPAVSAPVGSAYLPTDADGVIAAGATAEVAAGFTVAVDAVGSGWGCARPDPSFLELDAAGALLDACAGGLSRLSGGAPPSAAAAWLIADSYLAITGPATWRVEGPGDGSKRLMLGGTWSRMRCGLASAQGTSTAGERDIACWITDAEGNRPSIAIDASAAEDVRITASLIPTRERRFHIFTGAATQPADRYAETAAAFRLASGPLFRTAMIDVGEPAPVASVTLARAAGASGPVPRGGTANLEVRIRAAGGAAADAAAIASITLTATRGSLSGSLCPGAARSCTINAGPGTGFAAAVAANPALPAALPIAFTPPAGEGSARISLAVTTTGGAQSLYTDALDLTFAGAASALRAGAGLPLLHHRATPDDDRDVIELEISAADSSGNAAALPSATARVLDAAGSPVAQGFLIERLCQTGASKCKYRITATAAATAPLAAGRYRLEVAPPGLRPLTAPFGVAGPAAALDPVPAGPPLLGRTLDIQVDASDADGNPVADGTTIRVRATAADGPSPLQLATPPSDSATEQSASLTTKDGAATATFVTASQAIAIISFDAQDGPRTTASAVQLIDARNAPLPGQPAPPSDPASPAAHLADGAGRPADPSTTSGLTVWAAPADATTATAADLFNELPGAQALLLWNGRRWIRYAIDPQGNPIPGSQNFPLHPQDLLFIAR